MAGFSNYVVYVDESGDHSLESIDPEYPVFVLACCIFKKADYAGRATPLIQDFKFRHFGHDIVILHSHDIRKQIPPFAFLQNQAKRERFMADLNELVTAAPFTLVASIIDKIELQQQYVYPDNPYDLAMTFCMERIYAFLRGRRDVDRLTYVVVERRGEKEDKDLELAFRRICAGANQWGPLNNFDITFAEKSINSGGLQLADLVAHPIGRHILKPDQPNRAYEIVDQKFRRSPDGKKEGWGLKIFP